MSTGSRINRLLKPFGLQVRRISAAGPPGLRDPTSSHMISPDQHDRLIHELSAAARGLLDDAGLETDFEIETAIRAFLNDFSERPVRDGTPGSSGFHNLFWLFMISRSVLPEVVVESGVFKGQSTWMLRKANPQAEIHAFDLSFRPLVYSDPRISYHQCDWLHEPIDATGRRGLIYFDCHVDQASRVEEAYTKGFRILLFDDSPPSHKLYGYGKPGLPTINMVMDSELRDGENLEWMYQGLRHNFTFEERAVRRVRSLIEGSWILPDVGTLTLYGGFSFLTLVKLVP